MTKSERKHLENIRKYEQRTNDDLWSRGDLEDQVLHECQIYDKALDVLYNTYTPEMVRDFILSQYDVLNQYNQFNDEDVFVEWVYKKIDTIWRIPSTPPQIDSHL